MTKLKLEITIEQAEALSEALDTYARITTGQLEFVTELVRGRVIAFRNKGEVDAPLDYENLDRLEEAIFVAKNALGHHSNGSFGIAHELVPTNGKRAWEIKKVVDKELALLRDPNPTMRGVHYDGLLMRLTDDEPPVASVS